MLIDTHCHLYSEELTADIESIISNSVKNGVSKIVMPNIDINSIEPMLNLEKNYSDICIPAMGLHPCYVQENPTEQLEIIANWLSKRPFKAIGECGLDLYWDKTTLPQQLLALEAQFELANTYKLPLLLHTRDSTQLVIDLIKKFHSENKKITGVFHCFSGTLEEAEEIISLGFYLGIGGVLTFKNGVLDKIVDKIDLKHLILETDSPYLAPVPHRGKRNEPSYTLLVANKLAEIKNVSVEEIAKITTKNAEKLFKINE